MKFFDCYAHLGLVASDSISLLRLVQEAKRGGVTHIVNISNNLQELARVREMADSFVSVFYAAGFAPSEANTLPSNWLAEMEKMSETKKVLAIGATGLDYSQGTQNKNSQIELFIKQLDLARKKQKPVIVYNRNADDDVKEILRANTPDAGVIFHCYSGTAEYALSLLKQFKVPTFFSFAGNLTFRNSRDLHKTILRLPLDRILVETSSPFLSPSIFTGSKNMPVNIFATVEFISEVLDMDFEVCAKKIYENSLRAFYLK